MSSEALAWAIRAKIKRSSTKNLLMIVADLANHITGHVFASLTYLEQATGLSKKTVIAALQELESPEMGVLERNGQTAGRSGQIPVYVFHMSELVPAIPRAGGKLHQSDRPVEKGVLTGGKTPPGPVEKRHTEPSIGNQGRNQGIPPLPSEGEPPQPAFDLEQTEQAVDLVDHVFTGWKSLAERYPRIQVPRTLNDARKKKIRARAGEIVRVAGGCVTARQIWNEVLHAIAADKFLRGEAPPTQHYPQPFSLGIDYVLRPAQFLRILEKAAINEQDTAATHDPVTGRRYGPVEQDGRAALERFLARRQSR